ncbi:MAG: hypothetical protein IPF60_07030 [Betaproteobacteria bacterium]|nr:hypothetical protein [Betaproteobacteria bacterium]
MLAQGRLFDDLVAGRAALSKTTLVRAGCLPGANRQTIAAHALGGLVVSPRSSAAISSAQAPLSEALRERLPEPRQRRAGGSPPES